MYWKIFKIQIIEKEKAFYEEGLKKFMVDESFYAVAVLNLDGMYVYTDYYIFLYMSYVYTLMFYQYEYNFFMVDKDFCAVVASNMVVYRYICMNLCVRMCICV
jgi:hypothetical protein